MDMRQLVARRGILGSILGGLEVSAQKTFGRQEAVDGTQQGFTRLPEFVDLHTMRITKKPNFPVGQELRHHLHGATALAGVVASQSAPVCGRSVGAE